MKPVMALPVVAMRMPLKAVWATIKNATSTNSSRGRAPFAGRVVGGAAPVLRAAAGIGLISRRPTGRGFGEGDAFQVPNYRANMLRNQSAVSIAPGAGFAFIFMSKPAFYGL